MKGTCVFLLALAIAAEGCAMHINKRVVAVSAITIGSAIVAAKADQDCRINVGVGPCYGHYGPAKAIEGLRIGEAGFSVLMGLWWKKEYGKGWWAFPAGITALNSVDAAIAWHKHCRPGTHLDMHDPFGSRYCE
jgi:hypothetical protein